MKKLTLIEYVLLILFSVAFGFLCGAIGFLCGFVIKRLLRKLGKVK
jgi:hypothetical protein